MATSRACFDGRIEQAPDGGTILRGAIAPPLTSLPVFLIVLVGFVFDLAADVHSLVLGHPGEALASLSIGCAGLALWVSIALFTPRQIRPQSRCLVGEISEILGSTATIGL
ncbi:MAG TPA: hypothetical protein VHZ03_25025 [Trebonia sp.]|nr:hypothetical protein [Trebonia sp.]